MKHRDLIRLLVQNGCFLKRNGKKHDLYINPATGASSAVPRHSEIKETMARIILKELSIEIKNN